MSSFRVGVYVGINDDKAIPLSPKVEVIEGIDNNIEVMAKCPRLNDTRSAPVMFGPVAQSGCPQELPVLHL